ncbi:E3 ubiquitin-protein ligase RING1-like [Bidens hawaiensis]|uniref:E3 ubiquitin-protein ligase RING1-like n=1 Tax=Bidens hawaiensis TaxID=980011 RepID=UPI00404B45DD
MAAPNQHRKLIVNLINPSNATASYPFCLIDCNRNSTPPASAPPIALSTALAVPLPDHHSLLLSLPLKISLIFLIATFVYTVYKFYTVWCRSGASPVPENQDFTNSDELDVLDHPIWYIRTVGLPASVINGLTVVSFSKSDGSVEGCDCSVCLTEFEEDDTLRVLPNCKHAFHVRCIDTWLRSHTNCPLCRAVIVDNNNNNNNGVDTQFVGA